jgi:uncharacterized membrane protein YbhN (UPF0104 family)
MKKSFVTIIQYLFFISLGVFFVWLSVKDIKHEQWLQIKDSIQRARHWIVFPVILMLLLSHYSRALRWKILMEPLGYKPSTFNTFASVMIGYLVNTGVPRLGEVVKCTLLSKYEKLRADKLIGTIVMERAVDVVCLLIVFVAAIIFQWHIIGDFVFNAFGKFFTDRTGHTSMVKLVIGLVSIILIFSILYFILKRFGHIDAIAKIKEIIRGILHGLSSIHTVLIWALYLFSTTAGIYALQETAHLGFGGGLTTLVMGSVGMIISPGGIGAYALVVAKLMKLYGLDEDTIGAALGWLLWSVQTLIILVGGLIFFSLFSYYNKKEKKLENSQQHSK